MTRKKKKRVSAVWKVGWIQREQTKGKSEMQNTPLMANVKGEFAGCVEGAAVIGRLKNDSVVMTAGNCPFRSREVLSCLLRCSEPGVPFTNYGVAIAYGFGIFERARHPFPDALSAYGRKFGISK